MNLLSHAFVCSCSQEVETVRHAVVHSGSWVNHSLGHTGHNFEWVAWAMGRSSLTHGSWPIYPILRQPVVFVAKKTICHFQRTSYHYSMFNICKRSINITWCFYKTGKLWSSFSEVFLIKLKFIVVLCSCTYCLHMYERIGLFTVSGTHQ